MGDNLFEFAKKMDENRKVEEKAEGKIHNNENVEQVYDKYKNFSQGQLVDELLKEVDKSKQNGTYNFDSIKNSANNITPYLNDSQKQMLDQLLNRIK